MSSPAVTRLINGMAEDVQGPAEPSEFTRHAEIAYKVQYGAGRGYEGRIWPDVCFVYDARNTFCVTSVNQAVSFHLHSARLDSTRLDSTLALAATVTGRWPLPFSAVRLQSRPTWLTCRAWTTFKPPPRSLGSNCNDARRSCAGPWTL